MTIVLQLAAAQQPSAAQQSVLSEGGSWWVLPLLILLALVVGAAVLLRRAYRTRRQLERRVQELSALSEAGRAIVAAQLDVDELCTLIYRQARQLVDTWIFQLGLFEGHNYHIKVWIRRGERQPEAVFDLSEGEGIVGWMRRTGRPLLVRDFETELAALPARPRYASDHPPRSAVFVPLVAGETVIGAMAIQSDRPAAFTPDHQRVLSIIANQAAAAITNARMYQAERKGRRAANTLREVSDMISASLETDQVLDGILEGLALLVDYDGAAILLLDDRKTFTLRAARGLSRLDEAVGKKWPLGEGQRIRRLAEARQALLFGPDDEVGPYHQILDFPPDHSCLGAPILIQDELSGVLSVDAREPNQYDEQDVALVAALAGQAAAALTNARLYAQGQEEAWISTALLEVAEATSMAESLDEILDTVVRITPLLVGVDQCTILLWSEEEAAHRVAAVYETGEGETALEEGQLISPGAWLLLDRLWERSAPVVDEFGGVPGAPATQEVETTLLALPLRVQGALTGAMVIGFTGHVSFTEHRVKLIAGIANQTALAIESAQLAIAQQEEAWVSLALLQVAEAVATVSELDKVLATVARLTPLLVGVESCLIYLWDPEEQLYRPAASYGLQQVRAERFQNVPIPADDWPELSLVERPDAIDVPPEERSLMAPLESSGAARGQVPLVPGPPPPVAEPLGLHSPFALPLLAWGEVMGALVVDTLKDGAQPVDRRLSILLGVAQQTATAIQNAHLQIESIERQKLERELELARQIQASFLPGSVPEVPGWDLAAFWQGARQVSGDFYDFVPLDDLDCPGGRWGFVVADVADKGVPAALFMALSRTLVRTMAIGECDPARVLRRANDMILADSRSDLFVTLFYAILDPERAALVYANAGHNPPLHFSGCSDQVVPLDAHGMAMGIVTGIEVEQKETQITPGDLLLFYTDGVTDALNEQMEEFGVDRLCNVVQAHRTASATEVVRAINRAVDEFVGDAPQFDDFTLVVLKRQPESVVEPE